MSEFYIGQIMMTGFGYAQKYFAMCNGQIMSIQQNQALFALLGTSYGGNGVNNFALPDLRGRVPVGAYPSADPSWQPAPYAMGQSGGVENVTLQTSNLPMHTHAFQASTSAGTATVPNGGLFGQAVIQGGGSENIYTPANGGKLVPLDQGTLGPYGGSQPHSNVQPSSVINFNIALSGIWPSRN